ncbi:MAG: hypothetical protein V3T98_01530 [Candidatus Paceibacterota bacterium]
MLKISQQQVSERWDTLPMSLRETLYSPEYGKMIWRIGAEHHLDDRKIGVIAGIAGYTVFGFLQSEDLSKEIRDSIDINPEIAASISREIDRKIFAPIRADLEKIYAPPTEELGEVKPLKIEEEIIDLRVKPTPAKAHIDAKTLVDKEPTFAPASAKAMADKKAMAGEEKPVEAKPEIIPPKEIVSEVEPLKIEKKTEEVKPPTPPTEIPRESAPEGGPKIIHEQKKISPLTDARKRSLSGLFGFLKKETKDKKHEIKPAPIKATIESPTEIPIEIPKETHKIAKTEIPKPRVVHYGGLQTPSPFGQDVDKHRQDAEQRGQTESTSSQSEFEKKPKPPGNLPIENQRKSASSPHKSTIDEEDVIDLRTFEKLKKPQ